MKKLILLLFVLLSFNIYSSENITQITTTHPIVYARIKVKTNNNVIYFLRYDKIDNIIYDITNGKHRIVIIYKDLFGGVEINGKDLCEEFIREFENFNYNIKNPRTGMIL